MATPQGSIPQYAVPHPVAAPPQAYNLPPAAAATPVGSAPPVPSSPSTFGTSQTPLNTTASYGATPSRFATMTGRERWFEIIRYVLYALGIVFGIMMWGVTADKLKGNNYKVQTIAGPVSLPDEAPSCVIFNVEFNSAGRLVDADESSLCDAILALGVIMTLALVGVVVWHSLTFCIPHTMPYLVEGIVLACMALIWFILGIVAVASIPSEARSVVEAARVCIAAGWIAGLCHAGGCAIAFIDFRYRLVAQRHNNPQHLQQAAQYGAKMSPLPQQSTTSSHQTGPIQPPSSLQQQYSPTQPVPAQNVAMYPVTPPDTASQPFTYTVASQVPSTLNTVPQQPSGTSPAAPSQPFTYTGMSQMPATTTPQQSVGQPPKNVE